VILEQGEAHFKVTHNALRPFRVEAGNGVIRDLGTEFDVYKRPDAVQITLIEGKVDVGDLRGAVSGAQSAKSVELNAGEQISVIDGGLSQVGRANIPKATAWLQGLLIFDQERLADAVAEVNRYSAVKLLVVDPRLADLRISGVFHTGNTQSFLNALRASFAIGSAPAPDGTLMLKHEVKSTS
jgi:transmembrane sensor